MTPTRQLKKGIIRTILGSSSSRHHIQIYQVYNNNLLHKLSHSNLHSCLNSNHNNILIILAISKLSNSQGIGRMKVEVQARKMGNHLGERVLRIHMHIIMEDNKAMVVRLSVLVLLLLKDKNTQGSNLLIRDIRVVDRQMLHRLRQISSNGDLLWDITHRDQLSQGSLSSHITKDSIKEGSLQWPFSSQIRSTRKGEAKKNSIKQIKLKFPLPLTSK